MTAATIEREQTATTCTCYYGDDGCPVCPPVVAQPETLEVAL